MGKGDIKTKKGKIFSGSYGKTRPKKLKKKEVTATTTSTETTSTEAEA